MQRRDFLKGATTASLMSTTALVVVLPTPSRAAILTTIIAVMSFVSAVASMFARPDGTAQQFAILNAKLDAILFSQQKTLAALTDISQQIRDLKDSLPEIEINEDLRTKYVDALTELRKLRAALVEIELGNANDETIQNIDSVVSAIYSQSGNFVENLGTIAVGNQSDVVTMEFSRRILAALKEFLPAFYAADRKLGQQEARREMHGQKYQFIANQILLACGRLRTRAATSLAYHEKQHAKLEEKIKENRIWRQWSSEIEGSLIPAANNEARRTFTAERRFATMQYMGHCTHGWSTNDIESARPKSRSTVPGFGPTGPTIVEHPWTAFLLYVPGVLSGEASYFRNQYMGLLSIDFDPGKATATKNRTAALDEVIKVDMTNGALTLPRRDAQGRSIGRFYCPGRADGDPSRHAGANVKTYSRSLMLTLDNFEQDIQKRTYENWVVTGLRELERELQNLIIESARVVEVTSE